MGTLVTGSMVTETVFAWLGLGQLAFKAVLGSDYPLLYAGLGNRVNGDDAEPGW